MKVVKPVSNDEYEQQTDPDSWTVIADIRGNAIPASMELTRAALDHWKGKHQDAMRGYVDFSGLERADVLSVLSAEKQGKAHTSWNRFGDIAAYKVRVA